MSSAPGRSPPALTPGSSRRRSATSVGDRKSTRLNSSHVEISYAVFCLKKKKNKNEPRNGSDLKKVVRREDPDLADFEFHASGGSLADDELLALIRLAAGQRAGVAGADP